MNRNLFYDRSKINFNDLLFSNRTIKKLLIPLIIEQFLNAMMGIADTMMVSRVGDEAISAVSSVDYINLLVIQIFAALATGAVIICSQYIGKRDTEKCNAAAQQVVLSVAAISLLLTLLCTIFCRPLLRLVFGRVEDSVMDAAQTYFFITALSYPFIALFNAGSAIMRAGGNAKFPMQVSVVSNVINVAGNAVLIFGFDMGVKGAAIATLISRIFCAVVIFIRLRKPGQMIVIDRYKIKPIFPIIGMLLAVGIPAGIENGMMQFGKLAIQSAVATLSTSQMAAQAMANMMESITSMAGTGVGIGMMTFVGQAIGAGRMEEAKYYIVKLSIIAEIGIALTCLMVYLACPLVTYLGDMSAEGAALCSSLTLVHVIGKPILWAPAFMFSYGMRAAGDVKYCMTASTIIMWTLRVALCIYLIRFAGLGPIAVWIALFADWAVRAVVMVHRYLSGKWTQHKLV